MWVWSFVVIHMEKKRLSFRQFRISPIVFRRIIHENRCFTEYYCPWEGKRFSTSAVNKGTGLWKNGYLYKDIQSYPLRCRVGKKGRSLFYFWAGGGGFLVPGCKGICLNLSNVIRRKEFSKRQFEGHRFVVYTSEGR